MPKDNRLVCMGIKLLFKLFLYNDNHSDIYKKLSFLLCLKLSIADIIIYQWQTQ